MIQLIAWLLSQPLFWAALGVVLGPFFFVRGFRLLQRKRLILDTPRSTVRSAALGPVEISGKASGPYTLVAPLSQQDCLYYRLTVQSNPTGDLKNKKMQELCAPLFLDDGTGKVMIYPQGCELQLEPYMGRAEYGKAAMVVVGGMRASPPPEFAWERSIRPGDDIFVLGTLQENRWAKWNPNSEVSELSRIGPGFVSQGEAEVLRHKAYASLDPSLPAGEVVTPDEFDLHPPMILMKGAGPFVISEGSQRDVVWKLHWRSLLYIWGGPVAALWGLWEIFMRAKAAGILPGDF
jgi:hypothetical protein